MAEHRKPTANPIPLPDLAAHDLVPDERQRMDFVQDMIQLGSEVMDEGAITDTAAQGEDLRVRLSARTFSRLALMADAMGLGKGWGVEIIIPPEYPRVAAEFSLLPECDDTGRFQ